MKHRSVAPMRAAKTGYIILSAALCVLGIFLMVKPDFSAAALGVICGILLLVFGVIRLVGYFSRDLYRLAFQYDLAQGLVLLVVGLVLLIRPHSLMTFLCVALGIYIFADGVFKIQIAAEAKRFGLPAWWVILAVAIVTSVCGIALVFRPGEGSSFLMTLLGLTLLLEGILNFSTVITAVKIVKNQVPDDVIDVEWTDVDK